MKPYPRGPQKAGRSDHSALLEPLSDSEEEDDGYCWCKEFTGPKCPVCGLPCVKDNEPHRALGIRRFVWPGRWQA